MKLAFRELFGSDEGFSQISFSGRTDTAIFRDAVRMHQLEGDTEELIHRLKRHYLELLPSTLMEYQGELMPGIQDLLPALQQRDDVVLGLATGNFRDGAHLKLRHYGIDHYFVDGGFGDGVDERASMVAEALRKVANGAAGEEVLVIGDTPLDVAGALANGVVPVGVATGLYSEDDLRESGARLVLPSFAEWQSGLEQLLSL
jgi:phosphoglycolate phosphatase-like HAD superfamily hydrolase